MSFFIMKDNPSMSAIDAMNESKKMMQGHKRRLFFLYCSFSGWALLCILICFIVYLCLSSYIAQLVFADAQSVFAEVYRYTCLLLLMLSTRIGFLWIIPYMQITFANFYNDMKQMGNNRV
jgi:uncharacterized membrane protein